MTQSTNIEYILFVGADPSATNGQSETILVNYLGIIASFVGRSAKNRQSRFSEAFEKLPALLTLDSSKLTSNNNQSVAIDVDTVSGCVTDLVLQDIRLSQSYRDTIMRILSPAIGTALDADPRPAQFEITWLLAIIDNARTDSPTLNNLAVTLSGAFQTSRGDPPFDESVQALTISSTSSWTGYALIKSQLKAAQALISTLSQEGNVKDLRKLDLLRTFTIKPAT